MNYSPDNEPVPGRLRGKTITRKQLEITTTTTTTDSQPVSRDFVGYGAATLRDDDDDDEGEGDDGDENGAATPTRQPFTRRTPDARRYLYSSTAVSRSAATVN